MELVEGMYVSDFTKKTLGQFGWKEGDALPADLGQLLLDIKEKIPPSKRVDVLIAREEMPEDQIVAVEELLKKATAIGRAKKERQDLEIKTATMSPDVAEAYRKMAQESPQIIDDREEAAAAEKQPASAQEKVTPTNAPAADAGDVPYAGFCPRCGWNMQMKFDIVPSDRDKEDFLATLLGGARFRRRYELFGGRVVVTFRSVLAEENKLIYRQLVLDQNAGTVSTEAEWFVQLMDYRLACALDTITDKNGKVIASVPELDMSIGSKEKTPLVDQLDMINKNVLAQEATRRLVGTHLRQFQRLIEALEAMALEPSFWNGIE
jgi:hypothetical protein